MNMNSKRLTASLFGALAIVVAACTGGATATPSATGTSAPSSATAETPAATQDPFQAEWDALVAAAQQEGELSLVGGPEGAEQDGDFYKAFGDQYGIETVLTGGPTPDVTARMLAERGQGVFTIDIASLGGSGTANFLEADVFEPLEPFIFHPQALDRSTGWRVNYPVWVDEESTYCQYISYEAEVNIMEFFYNSDKVTQEELDFLQSWDDLLDPRFKGRIVIGNIAEDEAAQDRTTAFQVLGPEWFEKLLGELDVSVVAHGDERTYADGLARGEWDIALFPPGTDSLEEAADAGLPVAQFERTMSEGAPRSGVQRLCVMKDAPNPNAAKLFANWSLTVEGQTAFNEFTHRNGRVALRSDVPQGNIPDDVWAIAQAPGPFVDENTPEFFTAREASGELARALFKELNIVPGG